MSPNMAIRKQCTPYLLADIVENVEENLSFGETLRDIYNYHLARVKILKLLRYRLSIYYTRVVQI